MVVLDGMRAL